MQYLMNDDNTEDSLKKKEKIRTLCQDPAYIFVKYIKNASLSVQG